MVVWSPTERPTLAALGGGALSGGGGCGALPLGQVRLICPLLFGAISCAWRILACKGRLP
jgi:hypothetical protein